MRIFVNSNAEAFFFSGRASPLMDGTQCARLSSLTINLPRVRSGFGSADLGCLIIIFFFVRKIYFFDRFFDVG